MKKKFGPETALGKRRTDFEQAPDTGGVDIAEVMIEREPITVVVSEKGWVRALKGHQGDTSSLSFKGDDGLKAAFFAETTSKILLLATNGRVFTIDAAKLPGGRGFGEPIRLFAEIEEGSDVAAVFLQAGLDLAIQGFFD